MNTFNKFTALSKLHTNEVDNILAYSPKENLTKAQKIERKIYKRILL